MLERLVSLLKGELKAEGSERGPFERRMIAVAALLLEAMHVDHVDSPAEQQRVRQLLRERFSLRDEAVDELVDIAEQRFSEALDDWEFAEAVRVGFGIAERQEILTMLWEVAYADGQLLQLEDMLLERLAPQLDLPEEACEAARAEAVARAGLMRARRDGQ